MSVFSISDLIRCRNVSRVLLSDSLSGLGVWLRLGVKGALGSVYFFLNPIVVNMVLSLCIKFLVSVCRACIGNCLGFDVNFNPFLRTSYCV